METRSKRSKETTEFEGENPKAVCEWIDDNNDKLDDNISTHSLNSNRLSSARLKLSKALLKKKQIEKRLELERELKLLEIQDEVEIAKLECQACEEVDDLLPVDHDKKISRLEASSEHNTGRNVCLEETLRSSMCESHEVKNTLHTFLNNASLPRIDIMYFDGQPGQYHRFVNQFTNIVENKLSDKSQMLTYLLHYCKGKARTAIEACISLPSHLGYDRARFILHDLFGREHLVARELIMDLLSHRPIGSGADDLTDFAIKLRNVCITLEQMGYMSDVNSAANLETIVSRLPLKLQNKWAEAADKIMMTGKEPNFEELVTFMEERARIARTRYGRLAQRNARINHKDCESQVVRRSRLNVIKGDENISSKAVSCEFCKGMHKTIDCTELLKLNVMERRREVRKRDLCYLCLKKGHTARFCNSNFKCDVKDCRVQHHPMLHIDGDNNHVVNLAGSWNSSKVCLGVIPVKIYGPKGSLKTYAFLDSGSDTSLVCDEIISHLGLKGNETSINIATVNGTAAHKCLEVDLEIFSLDESSSVEVNRAYTVKELPIHAELPMKQQLRRWKHLSDLILPRLQSNRVGVLIGCDAPDAHWVLEQRLGDKKHPFGVRTHLGWMIMGPKGTNGSVHHIDWCHCSTVDDVVQNLEKLYNHEFQDLDELRKEHSVEDKRALESVNGSCSLVNGHFQIGLPWKYEEPKLPNNLELAKRRLGCLKRRLMKDNGLLTEYRKVMNNHLSKGYIVEASKEEFDSESFCWYIPHHPVVNSKKPGKLRIVFDCAATHQGVSLNNQLLKGPNTINSLLGVLLRFRLGEIALAADIEEMFLQVRIPKKDRGAFRLLWWEEGDISRSAKEYCLTVHPFGAVSSPFCANFALRKAVDTFGKELLKDVQQVMNSFYVDDYLVSTYCMDDAVKLARNLSSILRKGGFRLTKWISNSLQVIESIPPEERADAVREIDFEKLPTERTLGLYWNTMDDSFIFKVCISKRPFTRRNILSCIASIYDPLGLLAPFILPMKQLLQRLCKSGLGWDEEIPDSEVARWQDSVSEFQKAENIQFPRCLFLPHLDRSRMELHVFSDASEVGYGAVAYVLSYTSSNEICSRIITAKARVAPLKKQTIPRLELTAAVLAARIGTQLQCEMDIKFAEVNFWTDSMLVLYYIRNETTQFKSFVANRISTIQSLTKVNQWRYVPSKENVADFTSRGIKIDSYNVSIWKEGPRFLRKPKEQWPVTEIEQRLDLHLLELKKTNIMHVTVRDSSVDRLISYFSDWTKLLKAVTWLSRFKQYLLITRCGRTDLSLQIGVLRVRELESACLDLVRFVQNIAFREEIRILMSSASGTKGKLSNSPLRTLNPLMINGLLCVGGRLQESSWPTFRRHPIVLPSRHAITDLILQHYHKLEGHVGATQVLATAREKFWVLRGGVAIRRVIKNCIYCKRRNARPIQQLMAPLPSVRIETSDHPFLSVGIDYFGPIMVRHGRRSEKRYGCIFTCLRLRAVHLEVTHSFTTDSFIMALMRFAGRRGYPEEIYSDNGSNLVGAERELRRGLQELAQERIHSNLLEKGIDWHFNPPAASHWGGVWERMIRSVRKILNALVNEQSLTDECLETFMIEAERIVNNRPLVAITDDPNDLEAITPAKLLLLRENLGFNDILSMDKYSKRWKQANYLARVFWKRWSKEYVSLLQRRCKWTQLERNIREGDLVVISSDFSERNRWPLGLVQRLIPSNDGLTRQVELKTGKGTLIRDIRKLCLLEAVDNR